MPVKIPSQHIKDSFEQEKYVVSNIERIDGRCIIEYVCPNNHRHNIRWDHWKSGQRCAYCSSTMKCDVNFIKKEFKKEGYVLLTTEYINSKQKLEYICPNGHRHVTTWSNWQQGHRCYYCNGWKLSYEFVKQEFENEGYILLTKDYCNANQKLFYICPNGHKGSISWSKWQMGQRCLVCSNISASTRQTGLGNSNWRGGTSCEPYCDVWLDKDFKKSILDRDKHQCQNPDCWGPSERLAVHHIDYNKKNCRPENLITLCNSCNSRANKDREWHTAWYKILMVKKYRCGCE